MVWLNAAFSFFLALEHYPQAIDRVAIVCGIFTFVFLYAKIDNYLLYAEKFQLRKALLIGVCIKSLFQFFPGVELAAGMASTAFVPWIMGNIRFVSAYFITLTDGVLLSVIAALLTGLINFVMTQLLNLRIKRA